MNTFKEDVLAGLTASNKFLSSKYFYDDKGSLLFEEIMDMPEYYLTNCEREILRSDSATILKLLNPIPQAVVEFGSGDGSKTIHLLKALHTINSSAHFVPVDISSDAIKHLEKNISTQLPNLKIKSFVGDYNLFTHDKKQASLFLFLGSNIGNYDFESGKKLLTHFKNLMSENDSLLIGFDLQKNRDTIINAYDDKHGITKRFNLNLLERINRELNADFNLNQFDFVVTYNDQAGDLKSFLKSKIKQEVRIEDINQTISFQQDELIWTEISKKYSLSEIELLAKSVDFSVRQNFLDSKNYFALSLWTK